MRTFKQFFEGWTGSVQVGDSFGYSEDGENLWDKIKYKDEEVLQQMRSYIEDVQDEDDPGWDESSDGIWVGFPVSDLDEVYDTLEEFLGFLHNYFDENHHYRLHIGRGDTHPNWIEIRKDLNYNTKHWRGQTETDFS